MSARVLIADLSWYCHRSFYVTMMRRKFDTLKYTTPLHILSMVVKDASYLQATHILVAADADNSFRYKIYPRYKENRKDVSLGDIVKTSLPKEFFEIGPYTYLHEIKKTFMAAGIKTHTIDQMEADDVMAATAVSIYTKYKDAMVFISTKDKDLMSVINDRVRGYHPESGKTAAQIITPATVRKMKGVNPSQMRDYLCLMGDKVDCIPGVPGISSKYAAQILNEYGSIGKCLKKKGKWPTKLRENMNKLHLAKKLVNLKTDCWSPTLEDLTLDDLNERQLKKYIGIIPKGLEHLHEMKRLSQTKGLFR